MGRAMLIIVAGVMVAIGITQVGLMGTMLGMEQRSADYAESIQARNYAYSGAELAMQEILFDESEEQTFTYHFGNSTANVVRTELDDDRVQIRSIGRTGGEHQGIVMVIHKGYTDVDITEYVESAVGVDYENFDIILGQHAKFNGNDISGTCQDEADLSIPDIKKACQNLHPIAGLICSLLGAAANAVAALLGPGIGNVIESTLDLIPLVQLLHGLEEALGTAPLTGTVIGDLGSPDNPGVFFVGGQAGLVSSTLELVGGEGYGVMIIHDSESLEIESALLIAENFTFHGLVIVDNAGDITSGNIKLPNINGSLLVTNSNKTLGINEVQIEIPDNTVIQYDCSAWKYVEKALGPRVLSVYEEGRVRDL